MAAGYGMFGMDDRAADRERAERRARFDAEAMAQMDALYSFALKLTRVRDEAVQERRPSCGVSGSHRPVHAHIGPRDRGPAGPRSCA